MYNSSIAYLEHQTCTIRSKSGFRPSNALLCPLPVCGLLWVAAMCSTVQPRLSRTGDPGPASARFTRDSALDRQSRAMSGVSSD